jgi:hypothetical protein
MSRTGKASARPIAPGQSTLNTVLWAVAAAALLAAAGWRWHLTAVAAPVLVPGAEGPAIVLVVQDSDCPDRRAFMEQWIAELAGSQSPGNGPLIYLARVRGVDLPLTRTLDSLPLLSDEGTAAATRILRRAGVGGTPALVVVGAGGRPSLSAGFGEDRLELPAPDVLARTLEAASRALTAHDPLDPTLPQEATLRWSP